MKYLFMITMLALTGCASVTPATCAPADSCVEIKRTMFPKRDLLRPVAVADNPPKHPFGIDRGPAGGTVGLCPMGPPFAQVEMGDIVRSR